MRVLLIEDDESVRRTVELMLRGENIDLTSTALGEEGIDVARLYGHDVILLDLNLPDMHGYDVLRRLRDSRISLPVLILSGEAETESKVRGLSYGADDYITKPFKKEELLARIRAVVRRSNGHTESIVRTGNLTVNLDAGMVDANGVRIHLTSKEYAVLELLCRRKGLVLTKEMFLDHIYGGRDEPELKIIDVFVCRLRKKLATACGENYIETLWGRGYTLRDPMPDSAHEEKVAVA